MISHDMDLGNLSCKSLAQWLSLHAFVNLVLMQGIELTGNKSRGGLKCSRTFSKFLKGSGSLSKTRDKDRSCDHPPSFISRCSSLSSTQTVGRRVFSTFLQGLKRYKFETWLMCTPAHQVSLVCNYCSLRLLTPTLNGSRYIIMMTHSCLL